MSATVWIPRDTSAISVGAERVARAVSQEAERRGAAIQIRRNGSRGLYWLEPLIEVETPAGRIGYGPATPPDAGALFESGFLTGGQHHLARTRRRKPRPRARNLHCASLLATEFEHQTHSENGRHRAETGRS